MAAFYQKDSYRNGTGTDNVFVYASNARRHNIRGRGADLMAFLRTELRNTHLEMRIREREREERQKAFSPGERFVMLAEKNPELNRLKDIFGLELS